MKVYCCLLLVVGFWPPSIPQKHWMAVAQIAGADQAFMQRFQGPRQAPMKLPATITDRAMRELLRTHFK